jgi:hypothetical protein
MKVADILRIKGSVVKTVSPHETALLFSGQLRAEQIGGLVVSADREDDRRHRLRARSRLRPRDNRRPTIRVSQLMTKTVVVRSPEDSVHRCDEVDDTATHSPRDRQGRRLTRGHHEHRRCSQASAWRVANGSRFTSGLRGGHSALLQV